jgi:hypothetical protein
MEIQGKMLYKESYKQQIVSKLPYIPQHHVTIITPRRLLTQMN